MELKELFGTESLDFEAFDKKCKENGIKLADLSGGAYVSKDKYAKLQAEHEKYKTENDASKFADYDQIKAENETLKAEKETVAQLQTVRKAGVSDEFAEFVLSKVKPQVTAEKGFDACLEEFITANEQFKTKKQGDGVFIYNGGNVGGDTPKPSKSLSDVLNEKTSQMLK